VPPAPPFSCCREPSVPIAAAAVTRCFLGSLQALFLVSSCKRPAASPDDFRVWTSDLFRYSTFLALPCPSSFDVGTLHNLLLQTFEAKRGQSNPPNVYSNRKRLLILAPHFPSRGPTLDLFTALSSPGSREALLPSNFGRLAKSIEAENN